MKLKLFFKNAVIATAFIAFFSTAAFAAKIAIIGGKADDPFFAKIKKGIDDATLVVKAHGDSVNYLQLQSYDNIGGDTANLVRTAISQGASVIAVPDWVPASEDPAIKAAEKAGIPVMLYNTGGAAKAKALGAINYIGTAEYLAGLAGGRYFAEHGVKNAICVNTVPGAVNHEERCRGIHDGMAKLGAKSVELPLPASSFGDPTAVAQAIKATLLKDNTIDGVYALSADNADAAASGIMQAGKTKSVKLGSFDMDPAGLKRIKNGKELCAIDQQPWLQGFLAVTLSDAYVKYGLRVASYPILTGPDIIDTSNVDKVIAGNKQGYR